MMKSPMSRICKGILLIVFGVLFFLGTLGVWPEFTLTKYWPLVLIVLGLHSIACIKCGCGSGAGCGSDCGAGCGSACGPKGDCDEGECCDKGECKDMKKK